MSKINPENLLQFKSTRSMFDRIVKRLSSFESVGVIDEGDFHKHVVYVLEQLGLAVLRECDAVIPITNFKGKLPFNFKTLYSMYKCTQDSGNISEINEQRPWIFMYQTEVSSMCKPSCKFEHNKDGGNKIVIRTFVNGGESTMTYKDPVRLVLSPNVRNLCENDCPNIFSSDKREVSIDDNRTIHTNFTNDSIYMQYYGLPVDDNGLPMIPANEDVEKAVEWYIYKELFQDFYWANVPGVVDFLRDARQQYDFYIAIQSALS